LLSKTQYLSCKFNEHRNRNITFSPPCVMHPQGNGSKGQTGKE